MLPKHLKERKRRFKRMMRLWKNKPPVIIFQSFYPSTARLADRVEVLDRLFKL